MESSLPAPVCVCVFANFAIYHIFFYVFLHKYDPKHHQIFLTLVFYLFWNLIHYYISVNGKSNKSGIY